MAENSAEDSASSDETKRKFREALERKKSGSSSGTAHQDAGSKQSKSHGAAGAGRREFRRKSG